MSMVHLLQEGRMTERVLILGASGLFGGHAARAFAAAGWDVVRYRRGTDMAEAARGAALVVNALNPPNYHAWARIIPQITRQVLAAAQASGATVLLPGNVYVYGREAGPWGPGTPHRPVARKGAVRAEMEAAYRAAAADGVCTILLRGGDFLDPEGVGTVLDRVTLKPLARGRIVALGRPDARRAYAHLPDMARAAVALGAMRAELPAFADLPFAGHVFSVDDLAREIGRQTGRTPRVAPFAWWQLRLLAPFWELARELREMRYLYDLDHALDPAPLARLLPEVAHTPFAAIVAGYLARSPGGQSQGR
jgi:nucleoside-diphosphate-sugar epimerase